MGVMGIADDRAVHVCGHAWPLLRVDVATAVLLPLLAQLATDPVPNVRDAAAAAVPGVPLQ